MYLCSCIGWCLVNCQIVLYRVIYFTGPPKWHSAKPETIEAAQQAAAFCHEEVCSIIIKLYWTMEKVTAELSVSSKLMDLHNRTLPLKTRVTTHWLSRVQSYWTNGGEGWEFIESLLERQFNFFIDFTAVAQWQNLCSKFFTDDPIRLSSHDTIGNFSALFGYSSVNIALDLNAVT